MIPTPQDGVALWGLCLTAFFVGLSGMSGIIVACKMLNWSPVVVNVTNNVENNQ